MEEKRNEEMESISLGEPSKAVVLQSGDEKLAEDWRGCGFEGETIGDCRAWFVLMGMIQ